MGTIEERRRYSDSRFDDLASRLSVASEICGERACIYATGSFGRREAGPHSDIDIFIVSLGKEDRDPRWLSRLDEILLKADLIKATREAGFKPFSGDGRFLQHHTMPQLIAATGTEDDDATNTFTARLLLLLESRPLVAPTVHAQVIAEVIAEYWTEFSDHYNHFMPAYLSNDVLRYWRTLCLNYEARTSHRPPDKIGKRRLTNYKLKHSRMLTCYSALLFLLDVYAKNGTVTPLDAQNMANLTPIERVKAVASRATGTVLPEIISQLLESYERFLQVTDAPEDDLISLFSNEEDRKKLRGERSHFGDLVYQALHSIGQYNGRTDRFFRRFVV